MQQIPGYESFSTIEPVTYGLSQDRKYFIETKKGEKLFLRLADVNHLDRKQFEFSMLEKVAALDLPTPKPVAFGLSEGGKSVYSLFTWCEGKDAEVVLSTLNKAEQYALGVKTGQYIRKIHAIPAPIGQEAWEVRFGRKTRAKLEGYSNCPLKFPGDKHIIDYLEANCALLVGRPQSFQHGDFHVGNMVIAADKTISIIDFNRCDFGDPWEEFNRIVFSAKVSPHFASGQLNGYFDGTPPLQFFRLLAFYIASNTLSALPWAMAFGDEEINSMLDQAADVLIWFENMRNPIPSWYIKPSLIE